MEIRDKARALKGDRPDRRGGRPRRSPRSLAEGLEWVVRDTEDWLIGHGPDARTDGLDRAGAAAGCRP